jgi:hypothetical protein
MATSHDLTSHRRDLLCELVEDDPRRAAILLELLIITDPDTAGGAAARDDVMQQAFGFTCYSKQGLNTFKQMVLSRLCLILVLNVLSLLYLI